MPGPLPRTRLGPTFPVSSVITRARSSKFSLEAPDRTFFDGRAYSVQSIRSAQFQLSFSLFGSAIVAMLTGRKKRMPPFQPSGL